MIRQLNTEEMDISQLTALFDGTFGRSPLDDSVGEGHVRESLEYDGNLTSAEIEEATSDTVPIGNGEDIALMDEEIALICEDVTADLLDEKAAAKQKKKDDRYRKVHTYPTKSVAPDPLGQFMLAVTIRAAKRIVPSKWATSKADDVEDVAADVRCQLVSNRKVMSRINGFLFADMNEEERAKLKTHVFRTIYRATRFTTSKRLLALYGRHQDANASVNVLLSWYPSMEDEFAVPLQEKMIDSSKLNAFDEVLFGTRDEQREAARAELNDRIRLYPGKKFQLDDRGNRTVFITGDHLQTLLLSLYNGRSTYDWCNTVLPSIIGKGIRAQHALRLAKGMRRELQRLASQVGLVNRRWAIETAEEQAAMSPKEYSSEMSTGAHNLNVMIAAMRDRDQVVVAN